MNIKHEQLIKNYDLKTRLQAKRNQPAPVIIEAEIEPDLQQLFNEMDAELAECEPTPSNPRQYMKHLRTLQGIHNEVADKVNALRKATFEQFFRPEDKYIPMQRENLVALDVNTFRNPSPVLP